MLTRVFARRILLNMDVGELPDEPDEFYSLAHVVNIACGGHAGDDASMRRALAACSQRSATAGAHPSYPDREGFGRRTQRTSPEELRRFVFSQCARLERLAAEAGTSLRSAKPHGALYHDANADQTLARPLVDGIADALGVGVTIIGPPQGALRDAALLRGLSFAGEGFADRRTRADGSLVPRGEPNALIEDPDAAAERARALVALPEIATVCVHGDTPGAVDIARAVRDVLERAAESAGRR